MKSSSYIDFIQRWSSALFGTALFKGNRKNNELILNQVLPMQESCYDNKIKNPQKKNLDSAKFSHDWSRTLYQKINKVCQS